MADRKNLTGRQTVEKMVENSYKTGGPKAAKAMRKLAEKAVRQNEMKKARG